MTDWHYATLIEAADAIRSRKISPVELTNALLDRIARLDPSLRSYATVNPSWRPRRPAVRKEKSLQAPIVDRCTAFLLRLKTSAIRPAS